MFLAIGGTYVDLIEGGTNVGGTSVGWTNVCGRKVAASIKQVRLHYYLRIKFQIFNAASVVPFTTAAALCDHLHLVNNVKLTKTIIPLCQVLKV
jgi:hypothetical protein